MPKLLHLSSDLSLSPCQNRGRVQDCGQESLCTHMLPKLTVVLTDRSWTLTETFRVLFQMPCRAGLAVKLGSHVKLDGTLDPEGEFMLRLSEALRAWKARGSVPGLLALHHP